MENVKTEIGMVELPDGSGTMMASYPLPAEHWLYDKSENTRPAPYLEGDPSACAAVVAAARYAIRGATMCGALRDFDPDALVQNMVCALTRNGSPCVYAAWHLPETHPGGPSIVPPGIADDRTP